ncbi:MAG: OmpA family protein [Bacteroidales bacterium]|nr:OmpA family protein [Bacteroidales bacterium]
MFKRLLTAGALACTMLFAGNAFAQNEGQATPEYPEYGFWSNWSLGFDLMGSYQLDQLKAGETSWEPWTLGHRANIGWEILAEKELSPVWTYRISFGYPGMFSNSSTRTSKISGDEVDVLCHIEDNAATEAPGPYKKFDRYFTFIPMEFKLNLLNWIGGYNPERRGNLYALMGAGVSFLAEEAGVFGFDGEFGLGYAHMLGANKCGQIFCEVVANDRADIPGFINFYDDNGNTTTTVKEISDFDLKNWNNITLEAKLGWMFYLGVTNADKEAIAQKSRLTDDYVKGLENQISALEQDLANSKQAEQRLQNRVNQLESENANLRNQLANANKQQGQADDSEAMKNIKENQTNLYGMPFSIQYGVDQYRIPAKEREKLEAVAQIMKSDESVKYVITGFCDASGSEEYNQTLSEKRANTVKDELVNKYGVNADQISVMGYGKGKPFGDAKYSINRRVSFYVNMD